MRAQWLRAVLVFSALTLIAASGRAGDDDGGNDGGEEQPVGNKIVFDKNSPESNGIGKLKGSGVAIKGATGWKCEKVTIEILDVNNKDKVVKMFDKNASPAWSFALEGMDAGIYKVRVKGTFVNGTKSDPQQVTSGNLVVQ